MGWFKEAFKAINPITALFSIGEQVFNRSRAGYETSPQKRAFEDSKRNEQRIFERDAAYNSPAAQMQRFKDAGLNPNLIYGQGNPGNMSGTAVQAQGSTQPVDIVGQIMSSAMFGKELELKDAQIAQMQANAKFIGEKTGTEDIKQRNMDQVYNYLEMYYPEVLQKMKRENVIGTETQADQVTKIRSDAIHASQLIQSEMYKQRLLEADDTIRAEVLKGKQLQNFILEMQKKFVESGEMNATHFWQAIMMILSKSIN